MEIDNGLETDIIAYCILNKLDFNTYVNDLLKKAFMVDKYGERPDVKKIRVIEDKKKIKVQTDETAEIVSDDISDAQNILKEIDDEENKPPKRIKVSVNTVEEKPKTPKKRKLS